MALPAVVIRVMQSWCDPNFHTLWDAVPIPFDFIIGCNVHGPEDKPIELSEGLWRHLGCYWINGSMDQWVTGALKKRSRRK